MKDDAPKAAKAKANRPEKPEHLENEALVEWDRVCDELAAAGRLAITDRAIVLLYVETWQTWHLATRSVTQHGAVIKYSNGMVGPSPYYKVQRESALILRGLLADLGLTPASRGKGGGAAGEDDGDGDFF